MAATAKPASSTTPSPLNFLKEGLLLPGKNRRFFAAIFTVLVAWISLLLVANELGIEPLKLKAVHDMDTLRSTTGSGSPVYAHLVWETVDDYGVLLLAGAAYQVSVDVTGSAIQLATLFAAVATYSGDGNEAQHTIDALLGGAKQQLKGAVLTVAFACALKAAAVALLSALSALVAFLAFNRRSRSSRYYDNGLFLAGWLVVLAAFIFYVFLSFVCSLAVVVAVDEDESSARRPHRHGAGAGAVRRAWQLVKGRRRRAMFFVSVTSVLAAVFRPVYWQAKICARGNMAAGALLLGVLYAVQMAAVELFQHCALTAFYYECCKGRSSQEPETEYVKLSIQDA